MPSPRVADLGCGDGRPTTALHRELLAATTTGVDLSASMLARAAIHAGGGVTFISADLTTWSGSGFDVVFSNAALQWVPDHPAVLERWRSSLAEGGQLAVQVPSNADHPSHAVLRELAGERLGPEALPTPSPPTCWPPRSTPDCSTHSGSSGSTSGFRCTRTGSTRPRTSWSG